MNKQIEKVAPTLQNAYNEQYSETMTQWRELGAKFKAQNIFDVCNSQTFNRVLDCGAGEGSILKVMDTSNFCKELYAIDISDSGISQIQKRSLKKIKEVKKFNGYEIPYDDQYFDLVYCSHVLEHVEHPRLLLREIKRVSKNQAFEIPLDYSYQCDLQIKHYLGYGHINIFTPSIFKFLLKSEGFEILEEKRTHTAQEIKMFNLYTNKGLKKTFYRKLLFQLEPFKNFLTKLKKGKVQYDEVGFSAYTCFTKANGELKIF